VLGIFDYLKDNTFTLDMEIWEKYESRFLQGLGTLEKETQNKKRLEGGKMRGKK
jgi:hypothetical protein